MSSISSSSQKATGKCQLKWILLCHLSERPLAWLRRPTELKHSINRKYEGGAVTDGTVKRAVEWLMMSRGWSIKFPSSYHTQQMKCYLALFNKYLADCYWFNILKIELIFVGTGEKASASRNNTTGSDAGYSEEHVGDEKIATLWTLRNTMSFWGCEGETYCKHCDDWIYWGAFLTCSLDLFRSQRAHSAAAHRNVMTSRESKTNPPLSHLMLSHLTPSGTYCQSNMCIFKYELDWLSHVCSILRFDFLSIFKV